MNSFKIQGGTSLSGTITPQGAKNEALQIICAVLLSEKKITVKNIPDIRDIRVLIDLIKKFGVEVTQLSRNDFEFKSEKVNLNFMQSDEFYALSTKIRGSIMIMGPLLARYFTTPFGSALIENKFLYSLVLILQLNLILLELNRLVCPSTIISKSC